MRINFNIIMNIPKLTYLKRNILKILKTKGEQRVKNNNTIQFFVFKYNLLTNTTSLIVLVSII